MHQLVSQKAHHKEHKPLHRLEPVQDLLLHKTMPAHALFSYHDLASTSKQTPTVQNASENELHSSNAGGLSSRAVVNMNRHSNIGLPQQLDMERIRSKINRDSLNHHAGAADALCRDNFKASRSDLLQPAEASTFGRTKKIVQALDPSNFIDVDRLPSNYSQPFLIQHKDLFKDRQASFLSDNIASHNLAFAAPRSSQTSHREDSRKDEDLALKNSTDSNNKQPADFSHGKNSGIVLVEVHDRQDALADPTDEAIQIEDGRLACHDGKLRRLLLHSEIRRTTDDIENCHSTLRDLKQVSERVKRASEELIRGRHAEIKSLESKFERELSVLQQQLDYETAEFKKLWKKMMDC